MYRLTLLLLLAATTPPPCSALHVCIVEETALAMRKPGVSAGSVVSDDQLRGFDVEVRKVVLKGYNYTVQTVGSYSELMVLIRSPHTNCDVGWAAYYQNANRDRCDGSCKALDAPVLGNLSLLEQATGTHAAPPDGWGPYRCCVDFSFAYFSLDIGIMYVESVQAGSFFEGVVKVVSEPFAINYMCFLFLWMVFFSHLMWFAERRYNESQFPKSYIEGIDDAIWWAVVTVTTVGYGDKAPKTPVGRVVGILWMLFGLAMFSVLTGHMSSQFVKLGQRNEIEKAPDLQDRTVCGYASTFDQHWLSGIRINAVVGSGVGECGEMLRKGEVDAILMDRPIMQYYKLTEEWCRTANLAISPPLASPLVGLIYPEGSKWAALRTRINAGILSFINSPEAAVYNEAYFPSGDSDELNGQLQLTIVLPAAGLILAYIILQICVCLSKRLPPDKYLRGSLSPMRGLRGCAQIEAHPTRTRGPTS